MPRNYSQALRTYVPNQFAGQAQPAPVGGPGLPSAPMYPIGQRPPAKMDMQLPQGQSSMIPSRMPSAGAGALAAMPMENAFGIDPLGLAGRSTMRPHRLIDPLGITGMGSNERWRGKIDPETGTVDVKGRGQRWDDAFTNYLRTGQGEPTGGRGAFKRIKKQIDALRDSGWRYTG